MSGDILSRLHKELEGTPANSPAVCELLCEAAEEIERLRVRLAAREGFLKTLLAARDKRGGKHGGKRGDDDGVAEVILTGPPKTPCGGSPAFATRHDAGEELTPSVQNELPRGLSSLKPDIDNGVDSARSLPSGRHGQQAARSRQTVTRIIASKERFDSRAELL